MNLKNLFVFTFGGLLGTLTATFIESESLFIVFAFIAAVLLSRELAEEIKKASDGSKASY